MTGAIKYHAAENLVTSGDDLALHAVLQRLLERPRESPLLDSADAAVWDRILRIGAHAWVTLCEDRASTPNNRVLRATRLAFTLGRHRAAETVRRDLLFAALTSSDAAVRAEAAELLGLRGDADALPQLERCLGDRDDHVRAAAMRAIASMSGEQTLPLLLHAIQSGGVVAVEAMTGLKRLGPAAVPALEDELRHGNRWARRHAARVLGRIGDGRAIMPLLDALGDEDTGVRWQAVYALADFGPAVLVPLCDALQRGPVTRWLADGADRVLHRTARGNLWHVVAPLHEALSHLDAAVEVPVRAYHVRGALLAMCPPVSTGTSAFSR